MVTRPIPKAPTPKETKTPPPPIKKIDPSTLRVPGKPTPIPELEKRPEPTAISQNNPFKRYSLLGQSSKLAAYVTDVAPLFGPFFMSGQANMLYAGPGTGKTLLTTKFIDDAVASGRIDGSKIIYVNADDNSSGLLVKNGIFENLGVNMLAPGHNGMKADKVADLLLEAIKTGNAKGYVVIIDTLKKCVDLMNKQQSAQFGKICREFVALGGTIIALGHTTKRPNADGTPIYQGTTDILEDFDAVYVGQPLNSAKANRAIKGVMFKRLKSRADSPETVCYAFSTEEGISYEAKLASVTFIDGDDMDDYVLDLEKTSDPEIMDALVALISEGQAQGKMALARAAASSRNVSIKAAIEVLERYTGTTPREHLWTFHKGERGVQIYTLIEQ